MLKTLKWIGVIALGWIAALIVFGFTYGFIKGVMK